RWTLGAVFDMALRQADFFFFQAEDGIRDFHVTGVQTCALPIFVTGLGGDEHGVPRESSFIIAAASEIMAILALASDLEDLRRRVGRIIVAQRKDGSFVTAEDLRVAGAMTVLLKDALLPNMVQTMEGQP